jgi:hypothetical protein
MVVHVYNPSTQEAEAGGLRVLGHPELHPDPISKSKGLPVTSDSRL